MQNTHNYAGGRSETDLLHAQLVLSSDKYGARYGINNSSFEHYTANNRRQIHQPVFQNIRRCKWHLFISGCFQNEMQQ